MSKQTDKLTAGAGKYQLEARVLPMGDDMIVAIYGGDQPHIGAVAVASIAAGGSIHVEQFVIGSHREGAVASPAAEQIATALHTTVTVSAGMHWDLIDAAGIETVLTNARELVDAIIAANMEGGCS